MRQILTIFSLVILTLVLPNNFFFYSKCNSIFYFITYILIEGLFLIFFKIYSIVLNLLLLYDFFKFFHIQQMLRFDKATYFSLFFKFIVSIRLNNILGGSDVSLFSELINIPSIPFYNSIEFVMLLYDFLVTSFSRYKECMPYLILFTKFSDVLSAFTCVSAIGNL